VRNLIRGAQFKRDVKLAERRGKDLAKLREIICSWPRETRYHHASRTTLSEGIGNIIEIAISNQIGSYSTRPMETTYTWSARERIRTCSSRLAEHITPSTASDPHESALKHRSNYRSPRHHQINTQTTPPQSPRKHLFERQAFACPTSSCFLFGSAEDDEPFYTKTAKEILD
jgi:hypothetical protein